MSPRLIHALGEYRSACDELRAGGHGVVLVPTLGALHHGHQALMRAARQAGDRVIVSIFVNPTQFGPGEDFERYPRELSADLAVCAEAGVHLVWAPERHEIYPMGEATRVRVSGLTEAWCGASRPGHFEGVATVVTKLFAATGSCAAVFGRKDYQQLQVIKRLVLDLLLPVRVVEHPTVRDADGLATSSRNRYLSPGERVRALGLPRALGVVSRHFAQGERDAERLQALIARELSVPGLDVEYAALVGSGDLRPVSRGQVGPGEASVLVAARVGTTRLIDNITLGIDGAPILAGQAAFSEDAP